MGGLGIAAGTRETASALRWWLECGVDVAVQEQPRNWLRPGQPAAEPAPSAEDQPKQALPDTLEAFREWLSASPEAPLAAKSRAVLPVGSEGAEIMLLCEPPSRDELASGHPVGGDAAALLERMLTAIGMENKAYFANLSCFHSPGGRLSPQQLEQCGKAARHHVALARPRRLLLLGDMPARALLGKTLVQARGHAHKVEGVRTVVTFHPRQLLKRPSDKALAWKDLLLLTEEVP